ncbi:MAG: NADPH-dependent FMN reductase [Thermonemataceae bacterium]
MTLNFAVIYGSVRQARKGIRVAKFIMNQLAKTAHQATLIDPMEYPLPLLDKMYMEYDAGQAPENMEKVARIIEAADALIIVSAEYNHGVPAPLKNLLDHFQKEYLYKPSGIVTYSAGIFGGTRVGVHLRELMGEYGAASIPRMVPMPSINKNFDEEGNTDNERLHKSFNNFFKELVWYAEALKQKRKEGVPEF